MRGAVRDRKEGAGDTGKGFGVPKTVTLLFAPESYWKLTAQQKKDACNGCGTKGIVGHIIPDSLYGLSIKEACNIHDWMYRTGATVADKDEADRVFLNNMLRLVDDGSDNWFTRWVRSRAAVKYYYAVRDCGGPAFWQGKNSFDELGLAA